MSGNEMPKNHLPEDIRLFERLRRAHRDQDTSAWSQLISNHAAWISHNYVTWMAYPIGVADSEVEIRTYSDFMLKVAVDLLNRGDRRPANILEGRGPDTVEQWYKIGQEFEMWMKAGDYARAEQVMQDTLAEMSQYVGPAVNQRKPDLHERLSWLYLLRDDPESAEIHALIAEEKYEEMGWTRGVAGTSRRLADIARSRGDQAAFEKWMQRHANLLNELGYAENARNLRKVNGLGPSENI